MLDGRVKTLHPKIHAGILHDRQNKIHKNEIVWQYFKGNRPFEVNIDFPSDFGANLLPYCFSKWPESE